MDPIDRRLVLTGAGMAGLASTLGSELFAQTAAQGNAVSAEPAPVGPVAQAKYRIPFAVIGLDHAHIYSMTDAVIRGGGVLTSFYAADAAQIATFRKRYGDVRLARSEAEVLEDRTIKLVAGVPGSK